MSLDLEQGDEELANASPAERRRAARKAASKEPESPRAKSSRSSSSRSSASTRERVETELMSRLERICERIAQVLDSRGDEELASAIREDRDAMGQGLVSLTRNVKFLRGPLLMALNLIEPGLAFGRVGRILYIRFVDRQARIQMEREQAAANGQAAGGVSSPVHATP